MRRPPCCEARLAMEPAARAKLPSGGGTAELLRGDWARGWARRFARCVGAYFGTLSGATVPPAQNTSVQGTRRKLAPVSKKSVSILLSYCWARASEGPGPCLHPGRLASREFGGAPPRTRAASPKPALLILAARTDQPADGRSSCCRFGRASLAAGRRQPGPGWPPGTDRQIPPRERNARKAAHNGSEQRALAADGRKGLPVGLAAESQRAPPIPRMCTCASAAGAHTCTITGHTRR